MKNAEINITPRKAYADLALAVDTEFARHLSMGVSAAHDPQKYTAYTAEKMKSFICSYIDKKAQMQNEIITELCRK